MKKEIDNIRERLVNKLLFLSFLNLGFAEFGSLLRWFEIGFHPIYVFHTVFLILLIFSTVYRKQLSIKFKTHFLGILYLSISFFGLYFLAHYSAYFIVLISVSMVTVLLGRKPAYYHAAFFLLIYIVTGWLHVTNKIPIQLDLNNYVQLLTVWGTFFVGFLTLFIIVIEGFGIFYHELTDSINRRISATEELRKSEAFRSKVFDCSRLPIVVMEADTYRLIDCNSASVRIYGYTSSEQVLGLTPLDVSPPFQYDGTASSEKAVFFIEKAKKEGSVTFEWKHQRPDGTVWDAEVHLLSFYIDNIQMLQFTLLDITERKQAEADLRAALEEAHQRQKEVTGLLSASRLIPMSKTFGEAARQIFDICKDLIGAKSGYVALLSEDSEENEVLFLEAGGLPCDVDPELPMPIRGLREVAYRTNDTAYDNAFADSRWMKYMPSGHVVLENVLFAPLIIGKRTVGLIGLANKLGGFTDRDAKVAKAFGDLAAVALTYAEYQDQLRESEERLQIIFDNAPAIMLLVNANTEVLKMNQTGLIAAGKPMDKVIGLRGGDILNCVGSMQNPRGCGFGEDCRQCKLRKIMEDTFATDQNFYKIEAGLRLKKQDKTIEHTVLISTSIVDSKTPKTVLVTIDDITERKQLEKRIQQVQKMESIGNLAGGIAHDFNNILFPIIGYSQLIIDDFDPGSPEHESLKTIMDAGERGRNLVQQILAIGRQSVQQPIPVQIQTVLKEVLKLIRSTISANIHITKDIQKDCGTVQADPTQLHQIAMNLITNAAHAIENDVGEIAVRLREIDLETEDFIIENLESGRYAMLTVSDTGSGISPDIMDNLFDPYFTTKEQGKGTGLGLSVVHGIVKGYGGDITVYSEFGEGTSFYVYLPIINKKAEIAETEKNRPLPTGNERILIVDDEAPIIQLEEALLKKLGYEVSSHTGSIDALEKFKMDPYAFELVLTDMYMPNMTGEKLAQEIISIRPDIPVIICTGFSERIDEQKAENIGVKDFLMKPVVNRDMAQTIRKVIDEAKL